MNETYDYIILGTGLKECVLSGLLSVDKKTVLHMDRNNYYGGESASLSLEQLFKRFCPEQKIPDAFGRSRDYNVDLCPKLIMACGNLVKMLLHTQVTRYLEFKSIAGSYVFQAGAVHKVPATPGEAIASNLMGFFQKRRFKGFVEFMNQWDAKNQNTWEGMDLNKTTSRDLFAYFKLDDNTISFTGHALAMYADDSYLDRPAREMVERARLYAYSVSRYGNSPYIYPVYGIGGLPEGFSRLAAVHGGVYMLNKPIQEILYDEQGRVKGVKSEDEVAYCKKLIADPSYFIGTDKIKKTGSVARCICILSHPVDQTNNADSCQIIIPQKEIQNRRSDIYISVVSYHHNIAAQGKWIAMVSAIVETNQPREELIPALALLGKIDKEFFWVQDTYTPTSNGEKDNIILSHSFDPSSHFESATTDIMDMYFRATGQPVDLSSKAEDLGNQE